MSRRSLFALLLLATAALAAPTVKLGVADGIQPRAGNALDLLVTIDPGPEGVRLDGLSVDAEADGADLQAPILPPPDEKGLYRAPFLVRVPMVLTAAEPFEARARARGKLGNGKTFDAGGKTTIYAAPSTGGLDFPGGEPEGSLHLRKAYLRDTPAKAGKLNALVLELELIGDEFHVYGLETANDEKALGVPMVVQILPNGPEAQWLDVGPFTPPDAQYHGAFKVEIPMTPVEAGRTETRLRIFWQTCNADMCFESEVAYRAVSWEAEPGDGTIEDPMAGVVSGAGMQQGGLGDQNLWLLFISGVLAGLVALAMPCTYPLIPITISFFTKQGEQREGKTLGLALAYGTGIVVCFASIGAIVGLGVVTGEQVLDVATNPWVNAVFAALFLYFGLSLVGLYEINLPSSVQNFAAKAGGGSGYGSVFAMGATLVITSFTCTAPFVGALLVYAARSGDWTRVTAAMGVFGLTMAIPFVLLSLSPKAISNLPRSGIWMKHLKVVLGIVELGLVLKFLSNIDLGIGTRLIYRELFLLLWGASFLISAIYLMDLPAMLQKDRKWKIGKGTAVAIVFLLGVTAFLYSGLGGKPLPEKNIEAFLPNWEPPYDKNFRAVIKEDYAKGIAKAQELGAPVFLHFTGFQ